MDPNVHHCVPNSSLQVAILSQINPIYTSASFNELTAAQSLRIL
jgi:hypothetical protein